MSIKELNQEVFLADDLIIKIKNKSIKTVKKKSSLTAKRRCRLCVHNNVEDPLHEMFIVLQKNSYVKPHKHSGKSESFHIMEGEVDVVIFNDVGIIKDVVQMGEYKSDKNFFYRISAPFFHMPLVRSEFVVFHEVTNGPFDPSESIFAEWAPEESDDSGIQKFREKLIQNVDKFAR